MHMKSERFALGVVLLVLLGLPGLVFGYQKWRSTIPGLRVIDLVGYAPAAGGWQPENIRVNLGERVLLRIYAPDVVHGFAVPALGLDVPEIYPGKVVEVVFTASQVGRFPFACTRWCSQDHWRMRGEIEVVDPKDPDALPTHRSEQPVYQQLGIDLDAMRIHVDPPELLPSAARGREIGVELPPEMADPTWVRPYAPVEIFDQLRADRALTGLSDQQFWDLLAYAWEGTLTRQSMETGQKLYARDCAACHGESGRGYGPAGRELPGMSAMHPGMETGPADFTDITKLFSASDALLQGKVLRGGMGIGMPEWGSLYTDEEMWAVVAHLRSFGYELSRELLP